MFKKKRFWFKVLKRTFALLACVMLIFGSSFSSYAADPIVIRSGFIGNGSTIYVPVYDISYHYDSSQLSWGVYSGRFDVIISLYTNSPCYLQTFFGGSFDLEFGTAYKPTNTSINRIACSLCDLDASTIYASVESWCSPNLYFSYTPVTVSSQDWTPSKYKQNFFIYPSNTFVSINHFITLKLTYSVSSTFPLEMVRVSNLVSPSSYTGYTLGSSPKLDNSYLASIDNSLDSLENKTDTTNNKLQNLTDGYDNTAINNSNTSLNNSLTDYDTQEDEIISSATNFFEDIQTPISFFESGAFIAASSFVWQWLQGVYEHLGQAQVVVDVFLALTVAFSFVGLQKYIWRHSGRSSGGSAGKKGG